MHCIEVALFPVSVGSGFAAELLLFFLERVHVDLHWCNLCYLLLLFSNHPVGVSLNLLSTPTKNY
jgi:hypothetical protein